jgi:hypothetical protein
VKRITYRGMTFALVIAAMGVMTGAMCAQQPSSSTSKPLVKPGSQTQSIVLPQYAPEITAGPNVETYRAHCLICHTARYVSMQPRFSKTVWQNEVKKMIDVYGAPIPETDQALIVEYLVAVRGAEAPAAPPGAPK